MHSVAASALASAWRHSASIDICAHIAARSPSICVRIAPVRVPSYRMRRSYLYIRLLAYAVFSHAPVPVQRFERVALHLAPPHRGFRAACAFALCMPERSAPPAASPPALGIASDYRYSHALFISLSYYRAKPCTAMPPGSECDGSGGYPGSSHSWLGLVGTRRFPEDTLDLL